MPESAQLRHQPRGSQAGDLPPDGPLGLADVALLIALTAPGTTDLATGGLEHGVGRRHQHFVGRCPQQIGRHGVYPFRQCRLGPFIGLPGLRQHDDTFRTGDGVLAAENRDAALAHPGNLPHRLFHLEGIDVAPGPDNDVLGAAREIDVTVRDIGEVPRIQPVAVEQATRCLRVAKVPAGSGRPAELQTAFPAIREFTAGGIHHPHLVPSHRLTAGHKLQGTAVRIRRRLGLAGSRQGITLHPVDAGPPPQGREGKPHRVLGKTENRCHGLRSKTVTAEPLGKAPHRLGTDRLGAVEGQTP